MDIQKNKNPKHRPPKAFMKELRLPEGAYIVGGSALAWSQGQSIELKPRRTIRRGWRSLFRKREVIIINTEIDVDIVYPSSVVAAPHIRYLKRKFKVVDYSGYSGGPVYMADARINNVHYDINIITIRYGELSDHFATFDLSPTQVAYDSSGAMLYTDDYTKAIKTNTMELINFEHNWKSTYGETTASRTRSHNQNAWAAINKRVKKYNDKGFKSGNTIVKKILEHA